MSSSEVPVRWRNTIIPKDIQEHLDRFWFLLDSNKEEHADSYANLFTENGGYLVGGLAQIQGREAIKEQRIWAWKKWPRLQHEIFRVHKADEEGLDIVAIGRFFSDDKHGKEVGGGSAARFMLVKQDGKILADKLEVYSDPSPLNNLD